MNNSLINPTLNPMLRSFEVVHPGMAWMELVGEDEDGFEVWQGVRVGTYYMSPSGNVFRLIGAVTDSELGEHVLAMKPYGLGTERGPRLVFFSSIKGFVEFNPDGEEVETLRHKDALT